MEGIMIYTRIKNALWPVKLDEPKAKPTEAKVEFIDETPVDESQSVKEFEDSAQEIHSAKHNMIAAANDVKQTLVSTAKFSWHTAKLVFHTVEIVGQFLIKGFSGVYYNPEYAFEAAKDIGNMVKEAGNIVDGVLSTVTDLGLAAAKTIVSTTPSVVEATGKFTDTVVNYVLGSSEEEDETIEMDTFPLSAEEDETIETHYCDPELFGNDGDDLFTKTVKLLSLGNVFYTEDSL
jgi:hypothetical protein